MAVEFSYRLIGLSDIPPRWLKSSVNDPGAAKKKSLWLLNFLFDKNWSKERYEKQKRKGFFMFKYLLSRLAHNEQTEISAKRMTYNPNFSVQKSRSSRKNKQKKKSLNFPRNLPACGCRTWRNWRRWQGRAGRWSRRRPGRTTHRQTFRRTFLAPYLRNPPANFKIIVFSLF